MPKYKLDYNPKMQVSNYKVVADSNAISGNKKQCGNRAANHPRFLIRRMSFEELIEASGALTSKVKRMNPPKQLSPRVELLVKRAEEIGPSSQIKLLDMVNRRLVMLNQWQNEPTKDARIEYKMLMKKDG